jgi:hypothetical protein
MNNDPAYQAWRARKLAENNWHGLITGKSLAWFSPDCKHFSKARGQAGGQ